MYENINSLMSGDGGGGCCGSGSGSSSSSCVDFSAELAAEKIPGGFNSGTLHLLNDDLAAIKDKVYTLPILPNPLQEPLT
jgi:hypothetical protein